jgi:hypothetical protein
VIDSGCTNHMIGEGSMFEYLKESDGDHYITFAGNQKGKMLGTGNIDLNSKFSLSKVLLVNHLGIIYCPYHNFVHRVSIVYLLTKV